MAVEAGHDSSKQVDQGSKLDMGGYYHPDHAKLNTLMRPSKTLNSIVDKLLSATPEVQQRSGVTNQTVRSRL